LLESLMDRTMLQHMLSNMQRWAHHPHVLHLSVNHLRTDYVQSMRCMLRFLGRTETYLLERLRKLHSDPGSLCKDSATPFQGLCDWIYRNRHTRNGRHTTHGRYDNAGLRGFLAGHPLWAEQFRAAREAMSAVFSRQEALYGCPPEAV